MYYGNYFLESRIISLGLMEKELYRLYTCLAEKIQDLAAKSLFTYIATDSLKHTLVLASIIEEAGGSNLREQDCDENIRYNIDLIESLSEDVSNKSVIFRGDLISLIGTLAGFETLLYDEYTKAFHLEIPRFGRDNGKSLESDVDIFSLIVDDENRHQRILADIVNICDEKIAFQNKAPKVKYQNPDAWYMPPK